MKLNYEYELEDIVISNIKKYFKHCSQQVPLYNTVIDFAGIDNYGRLIAIEFKLSNWKKVLKQSKRHQNTFELTYVCLPKRKFLNKLILSAKKDNIGVITYDENNNEIKVQVAPRKTLLKWKPNIEMMNDFFTGIN